MSGPVLSSLGPKYLPAVKSCRRTKLKTKRIWKKKWEDEAVSPVIATILMVAITVVLAAVLYLLVTALITEPELESTISLSEGEPTKMPGQWTIDVASVAKAGSLTEYDVAVLKGVSIVLVATPLDEVKLSGAEGLDGLNLTFSDATGNDKLNAGDWFILGGTDSTSDYQIVIYDSSSGNRASGDSGNIRQ
jgi:flagellin-like protein